MEGLQSLCITLLWLSLLLPLTNTIIAEMKTLSKICQTTKMKSAMLSECICSISHPSVITKSKRTSVVWPILSKGTGHHRPHPRHQCLHPLAGIHRHWQPHRLSPKAHYHYLHHPLTPLEMKNFGVGGTVGGTTVHATTSSLVGKSRIVIGCRISWIITRKALTWRMVAFGACGAGSGHLYPGWALPTTYEQRKAISWTWRRTGLIEGLYVRMWVLYIL